MYNMETNMGLNQFCGPAVLSIYTGQDTDVCAEEISRVNGQFKIKGVISSDLIKAGNNMGLQFDEVFSLEGRSIFWAASVLVKMAPALYLVTIPKHYISLEVRDGSMYLCDNHTKQELEIQNSARLSQKVERIWKVTRLKEYSRPHIVHEQYHAELFRGITTIKRVIKMSDDSIKIHVLGNINTDNPQALQEIAFELMKVTGKENNARD